MGNSTQADEAVPLPDPQGSLASPQTPSQHPPVLGSPLLYGKDYLTPVNSARAQYPRTQWYSWLRHSDAKRSNPVYAAGAAVLAEMEAALSSPSVELHGSSASSSAQPQTVPDGHLAKAAPVATTPPKRRRVSVGGGSAMATPARAPREHG